MSENLRPRPIPDADSQPYWDGLRNGKVLYQHCRDCDNDQLYFRAMCKVCWGRDLEHRESMGRGSVYTFTVVRRSGDPAFDVPYVLALVELAEGPRVVTHVDADPEQVEIGDAVRASIIDLDEEISLLHFVPEEVGTAK